MNRIAKWWVACLAALVALSPVSAQKDDPTKGPDLSNPLIRAQVLAKSRNNLKLIGLAMHNYHDAYNAFPAGAIYSKDGKPLLSWRVAILPYIEEEKLYKEFRLDEPWDSEHNKKLLARMPKTYLSPAKKDGTETFYRVFTGLGTVFSGPQGTRLTTITDGTSNTVMAVEAGESVPWTKPDELSFDPGKPLPKLGGIVGGEFNVLMCDGSVRKLAAKFNEANLKKLITAMGGDVVEEETPNEKK